MRVRCRASSIAIDQLPLDAGRDVGVVLVVDARDLLVALGDDADLLDRRPVGVLDQPVARDAGGAELRRAAVRGRVGADHADERHPARRARRDCARRWRRRRAGRTPAGSARPGTGASGEMRVTLPTMKRSSMTSPTTSTWWPATAAPRARGRARGSSGGSVMRERRTAAGRAAANGSVMTQQQHHQELGIAEVVLEQPGGQHRGHRGERRRGEHPVAAPRGTRATRSSTSTTTNHSQTASAGSPRSAAICTGTLWRCGLTCSTASATAVLGVAAPRPCSARRRPAGGRGSCARLPAASPPGRGWSDPSDRRST